MTEVIGSAGKTEYLALAKSVKGAAAADLISRALDHAGLYTFGELLEMPNISSLAGTQYDTTLNLLKLFAYGDYQEYKGSAGYFSCSIRNPFLFRIFLLNSAEFC